jgi:chromosomal replication initiation ATPase DnaA
MLDKLLFIQSKIIPVPIEVIQECVAKATNMDVELFNISSKTPTARKREFVIPREISMSLCKEFSGKSLATIGEKHGGRDHATVLAAEKVINNSLDTNDDLVCERYNRSKKKVHHWIELELQKRDELMGRHIQEKSIFNTEK